MCALYHAVVMSNGAEKDRVLSIPGACPARVEYIKRPFDTKATVLHKTTVFGLYICSTFCKHTFQQRRGV